VTAARSASARIGEHYQALMAEEAARQATDQARRRARDALARAVRLEQALADDLQRAERAPELRRHADLLLAHLDQVPRGARAVTLPDDFTGGPPVEVALDPARSAKDNAALLYKRYKRLERARQAVLARWEAARATRLGAERALERLQPGVAPPAGTDSFPADLDRARPRGGVSLVKPAARSRASGRRQPYREFRSASGAAILVGRGADRNEELTFGVARGSDLWLHARDFAGAHVVVPLASPGHFDEQTLLDAATLAAHHSRGRDEQQVDVTYTLRKYVRKVRRARGMVSLSQGKTLRLRLEAARLARLLASRVDE
jgi:predicted ribosome quality control (RQC) complex YloA/Tae2 family protein